MKSIILKILLGVVAVIIIGLFLTFFWVRKEISAPNQGIKDSTLIEIKPAMTSTNVALLLRSKDLITNEKVYYFVARVFGRRVKPGFYEISPHMSMVDVMKLIDGGHTKIVKLTFPEGLRREQIAKKLDESKVASYDDFMEATIGDEGKLFPDTYYFNPIMTGEAVAKMMLEDFASRTAGLGLPDSKLILASIVEREAANDTDRGIIAGIYNNRLVAEMKLQSDPTVEYGRDTLGISKALPDDIMAYVFWKPAKTAEYISVKSPYNTYIINALPASPICNPGLKSIEAAVSPTPSRYYYFLYGKDGILYPSSTSAEHEALAAKHLY